MYAEFACGSLEFFLFFGVYLHPNEQQCNTIVAEKRKRRNRNCQKPAATPIPTLNKYYNTAARTNWQTNM
jgi:hypothetical protein